MIKTVSPLLSFLKYHFFSCYVILFTIYKTISDVIQSNPVGPILFIFLYF